jgi:FKBP-type peptidyl-prolyl cis-trans isomerase
VSKKSAGTRIFIVVIVVLFVVSSLGFTGLVIWEISRNDDASSSQEELNNQKKEGGLAGTTLTDYQPKSDVKKMEVIDIKKGGGAAVKVGDTITAHYTGAVAADGKIFESSKDTGQPATFPLNSVIKGWQKGVPGMKEGGTRRLIIPADLAYGANPPQGSGIPPNAALVFDIELIQIKK